MVPVTAFLIICVVAQVHAVINSSVTYCNHNNLKLNDVDKVALILQTDGSMKFHMKSCQLKEFTSTEAKQCLLNNNIVFLGDSVSRYIYLSLVYFIANGRKLQNFAHSTNGGFPRSIAWEKDFASWIEFYIQSNTQVNNMTSHSYEICDCHRDDVAGGYRNTIENRYFRTYVGAQMLSISMLTNMGHFPTKITKILLENAPDNEIQYKSHVNDLSLKICGNSSLQPLSGECYQSIHKLAENKRNIQYQQFYLDLSLDFEQDVLSHLNITHMIANCGLHSKIHNRLGFGVPETDRANSRKEWVHARLNGTKYYKQSSPSLEQFPKFIWRHTVPESGHGPYNDYIVKEVMNGIPTNPPLMTIMSGLEVSKKLSKMSRHFNKKVDILDKRISEKLGLSEGLKILVGNNTKYMMYLHSAQVDNVHFQPWFYNEMNNFMLNAMC